MQEAALHFTDRKPLGNRVAGVHVAVNGITDAFLRYTTQERFYCVAGDERPFEPFKQYAERAGRDPAACEFIAETDIERLGEVGCFFKPEPFIAPFGWQRRYGDQRAYSLCGVTHTMSTTGAMETVGACVLNPMQSWDAIICPSMAIRDAIRALWAGWEEYLAERTGGSIACPVQTPVIPLGIDTDHFARNLEEQPRALQRAALQLDEDEVMILFLGRLSYFSKAHPLPLFIAAERAAEATGRKVHLAFYGYFEAQSFDVDFRTAAERLCRKVKVSFVMNDNPVLPDGLWAGADIFASPSENIQESFGLTPVEAMASRLPVVITGWDGYREAITDGKEGFVIPTAAPPPGTGLGMARRFQTGEDKYGEYLAGASQSTSVDLDAMTRAFVTLIEQPDLRRKMGEAGMARARAVYDWRRVIPAYEALFEELAERRRVDAESAPRRGIAPAYPSAPDPFSMFEGFAGESLSPDDRLTVAVNAPVILSNMIKLRMNFFRPDLLAPPALFPVILRVIGNSPGITLAELTEATQGVDEATLVRTIGWLVKLGCIGREAG